VIRDHDELKGTIAGPRVFICAAELANHLLDARKDRSTFARTDQGVGLLNIAACCPEVRPEPIEIAESAIIARLGTGARPHPRRVDMPGQNDVPQGRLTRVFFARPVLEVAPELLGCTVSYAGVTVRLTEVEAYDGSNDPGSHAFRGPTARTRVMFGEPGGLYVYFTYGMHWCANLVCGSVGVANGVLMRAGEVVDGLELAGSRRAGVRDRDLASGPAPGEDAGAWARPERYRHALDGQRLHGAGADP
jgi:hypothetical protein